MTTARRRASTVAGLLFVQAVLGTAATAQDLPDVHSDAARATWCTRAQQVVAGTTLESVNVIHTGPDTFVESDATPYEADEGRDLPLTTHQLVTSVPHPSEDRAMASVVSCKLKGGEAIRFHYGNEAGELGRFCSDVHADLTDRVYAALTPAEQERLVYQRGDVVMDPDVPAAGGGDWTSGQPQGGDFTLPQIAYEEPDGRLHLRAKALIVPTATVDIPPFIPRNKQGTHYCHLIAPDHLRELVTGDLTTAAPDPAGAPDPGTDPDPASTTAATPVAAATDATGAAATPPSATASAAPADRVLAETGGGTAALLAVVGMALLLAPARRRDG